MTLKVSSHHSGEQNRAKMFPDGFKKKFPGTKHHDFVPGNFLFSAMRHPTLFLPSAGGIDDTQQLPDLEVVF